MKRFILIAMLLAVTAAAAQRVYVVILRNGSRIIAREKYEVKGPNALVVLKNGTLTSLPLDQIDVDATQRFNARGLGDAVPLDWADMPVDTTPTPPPTPTPSLGALGHIRGGLGKPILDAARPTPTPGIVYTGQAYADENVAKTFIEGLERAHIYLYRVGRGTRPSYLLVELSVNGEPEVNKGLQTLCEVYHVLAETAPDRAPERLEVRMLNESGAEAGLFRLSKEDAAELATGKVSPEEFFLQHVIF